MVQRSRVGRVHRLSRNSDEPDLQGEEIQHPCLAIVIQKILSKARAAHTAPSAHSVDAHKASSRAHNTQPCTQRRARRTRHQQRATTRARALANKQTTKKNSNACVSSARTFAVAGRRRARQRRRFGSKIRKRRLASDVIVCRSPQLRSDSSWCWTSERACVRGAGA